MSEDKKKPPPPDPPPDQTLYMPAFRDEPPPPREETIYMPAYREAPPLEPIPAEQPLEAKKIDETDMLIAVRDEVEPEPPEIFTMELVALDATMTTAIAAFVDEPRAPAAVPIEQGTSTGVFHAFGAAPLPSPPVRMAETEMLPAFEEAAPPEERIARATRRLATNLPIVHRTRFAVFARPWQVTPPRDTIVVVVKATFEIVDGEPARIVQADSPTGDLFTDDEPNASLLRPSDFAIFKPRADVMMIGDAYPPPSSAVANVRFRFGAHEWILFAVGDRAWEGSTASRPQPCTSIPLRWERALGGSLSPDNPVGRGFKTGTLLPNLERPGALLTSRRDTPRPICFAPISPTWKQRATRVGSYGARWTKARWPYLPDDFDFSWFNAAPLDQQVTYPRGDERFEMTAVHPELQVIQGVLPGLHPKVYAQRTAEAGGELVALHLNLDTVLFDAAAMRVTLTWRGLLAVKDAHASDLTMLFVEEEPLDRASDIDAVIARLQAQLLPIDATLPDVEPDNDAAPETPSITSDVAEAQRKRRRAKRRAKQKPLDVKTPRAPTIERAQVEAWLAEGTSLAGKDLSNADLRALDFSQRDLQRTILTGATLVGARFEGANCQGLIAKNANAARSSWVGADLADADLTGIDLTEAILDDAKLPRASLSRAQAPRAHFRRAIAPGAQCVGLDLTFADLGEAQLTKVDLSQTKLAGARFNDADLTDAKVYEAIGARAIFDDATLLDTRFERAQLPLASFRGASARGSTWEQALLDDATFQGADLREAGMIGASARNALFDEADLRNARLRSADLVGAMFVKANLMQATLEDADLNHADFRGANLHQAETWNATCREIDVSNAIVTGTKLG